MLPHARSATALFTLLATVLVLQACSSVQNEPLAAGMQTLTGVLVPVPLSTSRRGTHVFEQDGVQRCLVESSAVNLRSLEDVRVVVQGTLESNIDPQALPVLVATDVRLVPLAMHTWTIPSLGVRLDTPEGWNLKEYPDGARFTLTGSTLTVMTVYFSPTTVLPMGHTVRLPGGTAVQTMSGTTTILYVAHQPLPLILSLSERSNTHSDVAIRIARSLRFIGMQSSSASTSRAPSTHGSGAIAPGMPCGGPAGILCPSGQFCEIVDTTERIGRCKKLL